jgi:hypothetical protein
MAVFDEFTEPGSFRRWIEKCRQKAEEIKPVSVPAQGVAFGLAVCNVHPHRIEIAASPNGRSLEIIPWGKQRGNPNEGTNFCLKIDKNTAVRVGQAILDIAKELPDEPENR